MIWSASWQAVTREFRDLASRFGRLERHSLGGTGPAGEELRLDAALIGPQDAGRCVVVSAGLHGVEGVAGSAIIRGWLRNAASCEVRLLLLHVLNPHGFAYGRRVDPGNCDLNRSFLLPGEQYAGSPPDWASVAALLAPGRSGWIPPKLLLLWLAARFGPKRLAGAIVGGQHTHPEGLFYGGSQPSELQRLLSACLPDWLAGARHVLHLDLHTGLGRFGALELLVPRWAGTPAAEALQRRFGPETRPATQVPRHFRTRGSLGAWCEALLPEADYTLCAAEFGTYSRIRVLAALTAENRALAGAKARRELAEVFAPADPVWRARVLARGMRLIDQALPA